MATGNSPARDHATLLFANETFYRAFAERDVTLMGALWAEQEPVTCLHPGWPPVEGRDAVLHADLEWTFPLDFIEVVYGDGQRTQSVQMRATHLPPFGKETFHIPFDATGQAWVRFAAWDAAGNGAMTMPIRLER